MVQIQIHYHVRVSFRSIHVDPAAIRLFDSLTRIGNLLHMIGLYCCAVIPPAIKQIMSCCESRSPRPIRATRHILMHFVHLKSVLVFLMSLEYIMLRCYFRKNNGVGRWVGFFFFCVWITVSPNVSLMILSQPFNCRDSRFKGFMYLFVIDIQLKDVLHYVFFSTFPLKHLLQSV